MLGTMALPSLTIPNGQTTSNVLGVESLSDARAITLYGPAGLVETVSIQVSPDGVNWFTLNDGAADIKTPAATKAMSYYLNALGGALFIRLVSTVAVAAPRTYLVSKQYEIGEIC